MESILELIAQNREEAGLILSRRIKPYTNSNTVVIGIPHGGVCVAASIAKDLSLPLEVMPCRRIKHPADSSKNIGSVSLTEVVLQDTADCIPRDFIAHQLAMLKSANSFEYKFYHEANSPLPLTYKTVILVDDLMKSGETLLACIREIKNQKPLKIIVAVPVVSAEAARIISAEVDDLLFLKMETNIHSLKDYYGDFKSIDKEKVKELLDASRKIQLAYLN
jgi:predicted phosphoribosyltransferase